MNTRKKLALTACLSLVSISVAAQTVVEGSVETDGTGSYVSSDGMVIKTGLNECLQTGTFSEDDIINKCEGIEDEVETVAEAEPEPVVEETVVAEAPEPQGRIDSRDFSEQTLFDTDSAQLTSAGESVMQDLFGALAEFQNLSDVIVTGHTDSRGSDAYNQTLSERRAQTVADRIAAQFPDIRIDVQGMGESMPVASNDTAEGRQLNRRVEVNVTATRTIYN